MASLELIALVLTGLSITASIVYYASVLSNANRTQKLQLETRRTQIFMQLHQSKYDQEGLEAIFARNKRLAEATRKTITSLGLELFAPEAACSACSDPRPAPI